MDQIYLPKNRIGMPAGQYVIIEPLKGRQMQKFKPYFYNLRDIEPLKLEIIEKIFDIVEEISPENVIITGSFLEKGFKFNDIDVLIIKEENKGTEKIKREIEDLIKIKTHVITLSGKTLISGLSTDPLYSLMLSKCVSKKRIIFRVNRIINSKLLDYHLLKSETLPDNFDILNGDEKYYLTLNMVSIMLFIQNKNLSKEIVDKNIEEKFSIKVKEIKENTLEKDRFIKKYKKIYNDTFNLIMGSINEPK